MKLFKWVFVLLMVGALVFAGYSFSVGKHDQVNSYLLWALAFWCGLICVEWMGSMEEESQKQTKLLEEINKKLDK
ncbi:MAG: hypothetical protein IJ573_00595 [Clostridia bacterium]|nr:hypothetical protein [Clostridia bacterium]